MPPDWRQICAVFDVMRHRILDLDLPLLTAVVSALIRLVAALGEAIAELPIGDALSAEHAGELIQPAGPVAVQLIAAIQAVSLIVAHPATRLALPAAALELIAAAGGSCGDGVREPISPMLSQPPLGEMPGESPAAPSLSSCATAVGAMRQEHGLGGGSQLLQTQVGV